jgi:hypothetical protein
MRHDSFLLAVVINGEHSVADCIIEISRINLFGPCLFGGDKLMVIITINICLRKKRRSKISPALRTWISLMVTLASALLLGLAHAKMKISLIPLFKIDNE